MRVLKTDRRNIRRRENWRESWRVKLKGKKCILCEGRLDGAFLPKQSKKYCSYCLKDKFTREKYRLKEYRKKQRMGKEEK